MTDISTFEFIDNEWENIPNIIPKMFTAISKQFNSISRWQEAKDRMETATEVKEKLNKLIEDNRSSLIDLKSWADEFQERATDKFENIMQSEADLEEKLQVFYTKLERDEFTDLNDMVNEPKLDYDTEEEDNEYAQPPNATANYEYIKAEPKFWNLEQLKTICLRLMKTSRMRKRQAKFKTDIYDIKNTLISFEHFKTQITEKIEQVHKYFESKTDDMNSKFNGVIHEMQLRLQVCVDNLEQVSVKNKQLSVKTEEIDSNMKAIMQKNDKLASKITAQDKTIKEKNEGIRNDMLELIGKSQRQLEKQYNTILKDIENAKGEMSSVVEHSKEYTWQQLQSYNAKNDEFMDNFKVDILRQQEEDSRVLLTRIDSITQDIESVRSEGVQNDHLLEKALADLMADFKYWTQNTIKPAQIAEAKIFSIETRQKESENRTHQEHFFVRDVIKKLIYTMETSFISSKTLSELQGEKFKTAPDSIFEVKRMGTVTRSDTPERKLKDSYEQVFVRRLHFLKSLLNEDSRHAKLNTQMNNMNNMNNMNRTFNDEMKTTDLINDENEFRTSKGMKTEGYNNNNTRIKDKYKKMVYNEMQTKSSKSENRFLHLPELNKNDDE